MSENQQPNTQNQSTTSTKKHITTILIKPDNESDLDKLIYIGNYRAGAKYRRYISELAQTYHFSEKDYKRGKISFSLDFAGFQQDQQRQQQKRPT